MAHMIARGIEVERCIDTGDMTKFDGRVHYGIESIYKMITSVMTSSVLLAKHLQPPPSDISELPKS